MERLMVLLLREELRLLKLDLTTTKVRLHSHPNHPSPAMAREGVGRVGEQCLFHFSFVAQTISIFVLVVDS